MNQEKIGKLIAKQRKLKGLTQQELGDKVGVGYRAVSKWETGLTMPDISIINELCEILGITSDELLKGELNKKEQPQTNNNFTKKLLIIIIPLIIIIGAIIGIIIKNNNKEYEYDLKSANPSDYQVEGALTIKGSKLLVQIDKVKSNDYNLSQVYINNYQYNMLSSNKILFGFGYNLTTESLDEPTSIFEFLENFKINYNDRLLVSKDWIITNNITLELNFIDVDGNKIIKQMEIILVPHKEDKSTK